MSGFQNGKMPWIEKDPSEVTWYDIDWTDMLGANTLTADATWTVPAGVLKVNQAKVGNRTYILVSGGTLGQNYALKATVPNSNAETLVQSITLVMVNK